MTQDQMMTIATQVYPNEATWDLLETLADDQEILESVIENIRDLELFSSEQEEVLQEYVLDLVNAEHIGIKDSWLSYVNWTDVIYALIKTQSHLFNPDYHA